MIIIHKSGEDPEILGGAEEPQSGGEDDALTLRRDLKSALKREARLNRDLENALEDLASAVEDAERRKGKIAESVARFREMMKRQEDLEAALREEQTQREEIEGKAEKLARLLQKSNQEMVRQKQKLEEAENEVAVLSRQLRDRATGVPDKVAVVGTGGGESEVQSRLDEANTMVRERRYDEAEALFQSGRERWPLEPAFLLGLATLHYEQGEYETAESMAEEAQKLDDERADVNALQGMIAWRQDQLKPASRAFKKAIRLNPDDERYRIYYGMVMYGRGRHKEALDQLKNAVILDPLSSEAQFNMAVLLAGVDKPDFVEARAHYEEALRLGSEPDLALEKLLFNK